MSGEVGSPYPREPGGRGAQGKPLRMLFFLTLATLSIAPGAWAQRKISVGYSSDAPGSLATWIARESGIFAKNGLDVQLVRTRSTIGVMALLSGELDFIQASGPVVVESSLRGSDLVYVAGGMATLDFIFMSQPEIKTAERLKGGVIGLASIRGASLVATEFALQKLGLAPKEVQYMVVGGTPERLIALRNKRLHATLLSPPTSIVAEREGFHLLADVGALGFPFLHNGIATSRRLIRQNPDVVRRYVRSQVEAVHLMKTDRQLGIKVLAKYLRQTKEKEILERSYDLSVTDQKYPPKQFPTLAGIQTVLNAIADENPKAKTAKPEEFVDLRFIRELDESGFIDGLYGKRKAQ
ncbi:MAG TPA: ABC transporter substrate-binding protein [Candidatus Eisenbacteria bacterium]|nr:ABC transporter substrate-binding protein [Candidatus Eisenbacteria bacterium]